MKSLLDDLRNAMALLPSAHEKRASLGTITETIDRNWLFAKRHPALLFQCLWNTGWWSDCDELSQHFVEDAEVPSAGGNVATAEIVESWKQKKESLGIQSTWMRAVRPPAHRVGAPLRQSVRGPIEYTSRITCSADGEVVAWTGGGPTEKPKGVCVWLPFRGSLRFFPMAAAPFDIALSPDGRGLACVMGKHTAFYELDYDGDLTDPSGRLDATDGDAFYRLCYSPDGQSVAFGLQSGTVQVVNCRTKEVNWSASSTSGKFVRGLAWQGQIVVSGGDDSLLTARNASDGGVIYISPELKAKVSSVCIHERRVVATTGQDESETMGASQEGFAMVFCWDLDRPEQPLTISGHQEQVNAACFVSDGRQILTCSGGLMFGSEHSQTVWDAESGREVVNLGKRSGAIIDACCASCGDHVFSLSWNGEVQHLEVGRAGTSGTIRSHEQEIRIAEFSPDGRLLATTSWDDPPRIWDAETGIHIATLNGHERLIRTIWFSPDSRRVITGAGRKYHKEPMDFTARVWNPETGECLAVLEPHDCPVTLAKFSRNGRLIVTGESDVRSMSHSPHTLRVWDANSFEQIARIGPGQPEFMISLVSGANPDELFEELFRMGVVLESPRQNRFRAVLVEGRETQIDQLAKEIYREEQSDVPSMTIGWIPHVASGAITPHAWHPATRKLAIANGHDLRVYRMESAASGNE